jgi:hypothetical protein
MNNLASLFASPNGSNYKSGSVGVGLVWYKGSVGTDTNLFLFQDEVIILQNIVKHWLFTNIDILYVNWLVPLQKS